MGPFEFIYFNEKWFSNEQIQAVVENWDKIVSGDIEGFE